MSVAPSLLSRGINVYTLPPQLLDTLSVRSIQDTIPQAEEAEPISGITKQSQRTADDSTGTIRCQTCPGASFETVEEQREHFKADWHRYNAKAKLQGRAVTAEQWEGMVEGVSSISGSASSSSASSSSSTNEQSYQPQSKLSRLLARQSITNNGDAAVDSDEEAEMEDRRRRAQLRTAIIWFQPSSPLDELGIPKDTQFGVHRALFPSKFQHAHEYLSALKTMQLSANALVQPSLGGMQPSEEPEERRITLLMVAGGHFAGMVVGLRVRGKSEKQDVKGAGDVRIIQHKTFHRYTTRKKQGGSQALNDNAKSKAVSAGAMLRRYGEQALQEEIRALMTEWEGELVCSEKIFIRASTHGKKSFWGYDGAVLHKSDERIRTFPFPTRRPTQQELLRCWHELTRVKVSHLSEEALVAQDEAYIASLQPKKTIPKPVTAPAPSPSIPAVPKLSPEEEARQARQRRIEEMIRKGKLDTLKQAYEKYPPDILPSHLHLASASSQEELVKYLLSEAKLDPTAVVEGKRAYEVAGSKGVRNVFRRVAHDAPDMADWTAARVPSGLSEEAEQAQNAKKNDRRKGLKEKMKERAAAKAQEEPEEEPAAQVQPSFLETRVQGTGRLGPQRLGGTASVAGLAGMSSDMRAQIERERRARAAEARFKTGPA